MHLQYVPINRAVFPPAQSCHPHRLSSLLRCESEERGNRTVRKSKRFREISCKSSVSTIVLSQLCGEEDYFDCLSIQQSRLNEGRSNKTEDKKKKLILLLLSFHFECLNSCCHELVCRSPPSHYNNKNMLNHRTFIQKFQKLLHSYQSYQKAKTHSFLHECKDHISTKFTRGRQTNLRRHRGRSFERRVQRVAQLYSTVQPGVEHERSAYFFEIRAG